MDNPKDSITAHLEKSLISNIISTARASLKEPSRPYTPGESVRALFNQPDPSSRPNSSYSLKALKVDMEQKKGKLKIDPALSGTRKSISSTGIKLGASGPVKVNVMSFEQDEGPNEENKETFRECKEVISILEKLEKHQEVRELYTNEDIEVLMERVSFCVRDLSYVSPRPKWAEPERVLKKLVLTLDLMGDDTVKVLKVAKCVLDNLLELELFFKKNKGQVVPGNVGQGTVKVVYQYSKEKSNDEAFLSEGIIDTFYNIVAKTITQESDELPFDLLIFLIGTVKNITNNPVVHERIANLNYIAPLSSLLPSPYLQQQAPASQKHLQLLVQVTAFLKNIVNNQSCCQQVLLFHVVERLCASLTAFHSKQEIAYNCLGALSTLSAQSRLCQLISSQEGILHTLLFTIELYRSSTSIVTRACYILANIVTLFEEPRVSLGLPCVWKVVQCALNEHLNDFSKPKTDVLVKSTRLIANIVIHPGVGRSLQDASGLLLTLASILSDYPLAAHEELILNTAACLTNILFYDTPSTPLAVDSSLRLLILAKVSPLLVQTLNEEITLEIIRILGNLTRHESVCRELLPLHIPEALFLLLEHSNLNIVFYSLGTFTNISSLFREILYSEESFDKLTQLLYSLGLSEPEISIQICMVLSNLCVAGKGLVTWESVAGEETVKKLSELTPNLQKACEELGEDQEDLRDLASVLEGLVEIMPKPHVACPFPNCGRKFPTQQMLDEHWSRRHVD